jgi:hypothetical protein
VNHRANDTNVWLVPADRAVPFQHHSQYKRGLGIPAAQPPQPSKTTVMQKAQ